MIRVLRNWTRLYLLIEPMLYSWEFYGFILVFLGIVDPVNVVVPLLVAVIFSGSYWLYKKLMGGWKIFPISRQPSPYIFMVTYLFSGLMLGGWTGYLFERFDLVHVFLILMGLIFTIFPGITKALR